MHTDSPSPGTVPGVPAAPAGPTAAMRSEAASGTGRVTPEPAAAEPAPAASRTTPMLARQRQEHILERVTTTGGVRVADVVDELGVSEMTARRDITELVAQGLVERVHGGAVAPPSTVRRPPSRPAPGPRTPRGAAPGRAEGPRGPRTVAPPGTSAPSATGLSATDLSATSGIAARAAALIGPGDSLVLSGGPTALEVARALAGTTHFPTLTVITTSLPAAQLLFDAADALGQACPLDPATPPGACGPADPTDPAGPADRTSPATPTGPGHDGGTTEHTSLPDRTSHPAPTGPGLPEERPTIVLTGGQRAPSGTLVGPASVHALRDVHTDWALLDAYGFSPEAGLTAPSLAEASTDEAVARAGRRVVAVVDDAAWGTVGLRTFCTAQDVDVVVTSTQPEDSTVHALRSTGTTLVVAPPTPAPETSPAPPAPESPTAPETADRAWAPPAALARTSPAQVRATAPTGARPPGETSHPSASHPGSLPGDQPDNHPETRAGARNRTRATTRPGTHAKARTETRTKAHAKAHPDLPAPTPGDQ